MRNLPVSLLALILVACGDPVDPPIVLTDGGPIDAQVAPDAGPGEVDAGPRVAVTVEPAGAVHVARIGHTATLLPNGHVLLIGGEDLSRAPNASIEEYDPETGSFSEVATLAAPRVNHTATLLPDGRVLVVGGGASAANGIPAGTGVVATTVLFDPSSHALTDAAELAHARGHHAAIALDDGRVLVVGGAAPAGSGFVPVAELEIYDPVAGTWSDAGSLAVPRAMAQVVSDDEGVLVIGGLTAAGAPREVERFVPATGAVAPAGLLANAGRFYHATLRTTDGTVLVVGGISIPVFVATVDALGPSDDAFRALPELPSPRNSVALAETPAGVLAIGGFYYSSSTGGVSIEDVLAYDPSTERFEVVGSIPLGRTGHTATVLDSGDVLVAGGYTMLGLTDSALIVHAE